MIYLDSAATSLLKPDGVAYAVTDAICTMASPGRGAYAPAMRAADVCYECRESLARLFSVPQPEKIVFTLNATHALNIAVRSLARGKTRVLISGYEHNSVTRPLRAAGAEITAVKTPLFDVGALLQEFERELNTADAAVFTHVSNVFGFILPIRELSAMCRKREVPFLIDASQSAGALDIDFASLGADFIAMPGHKGLMGPQGTGVLICKNEAEPLLYGGSGSESRLQRMPDYLPDRLEAGTHNVAGIAGLNESVRYILRETPRRIGETEKRLLSVFANELEGTPHLRLFRDRDGKNQAGVISLLPLSMDCEELGARLSDAGVCVRAGLHCAPLAHETAGTVSTGTVRASFSPFNSDEEAAAAARIIRKILKSS